MILYEAAIAGGREVLVDGVEKIEAQVDVNVEVWILLPVEVAGTLRELVPHHAGSRVLVLEYEFELLAGPIVFPGGQQGAGGDHAVAGEEPVVLRTPRLARGAVSGDQAASEVDVAHPRLIQRDLGPGERAIDERVGRLDLQGPVEEFRVVIGGRSLERAALLEEFPGDGRGVLRRRAAGDDDLHRAAIATGAQGEGETRGAAQALRGVHRVIVRNDVGRADTGGEPMQGLGEDVRGGGGVPHALLAADRGGPHQIQHGREANQEIDGACPLDLVAHDRARQLERNEELFPHDEIGSDVSASHGLRTVGDAPEDGLALDLGGRALLAEAHAVAIEDLHRIGPGLEPVLRVAEERRAAPVRGDESRGQGGVAAPHEAARRLRHAGLELGAESTGAPEQHPEQHPEREQHGSCPQSSRGPGRLRHGATRPRRAYWRT